MHALGNSTAINPFRFHVQEWVFIPPLNVIDGEKWKEKEMTLSYFSANMNNWQILRKSHMCPTSPFKASYGSNQKEHFPTTLDFALRKNRRAYFAQIFWEVILFKFYILTQFINLIYYLLIWSKYQYWLNYGPSQPKWGVRRNIDMVFIPCVKRTETEHDYISNILWWDSSKKENKKGSFF